ncbi:MAG: uracil-DNA glycosylase [Verrucomicrobiales bacterium]
MAEDARSSPIRVLLEYLRQNESAGQTHVWLSDPAREVMRAWHRAQRGGRTQSTGRSTVVVAPISTEVLASGPVGPVGTGVPTASAKPTPGAAWPTELADPATVAALAAVQSGVLACPVYASLRERGLLRDTMVFAVGNPVSPLVFVGEAPGAEEEKLGEPFVGPAGQLLTKMITAMGLQRSQVYITNIVKYRPAIDGGNQGSKNRRPTSEEIAAGLPHLHRELAVLRPRVLVALGATALEGLAGEAIPIGRARGQWRTFDGIPVMPTFHPSYLLHNESLTERRKVWEDLLQVMEKLGMPISAKQRAFFKT